MDFNLTIKSNITPNLVDKAEKELFLILMEQHLSFNKRWDYSTSFITRFTPILRVLGMLVSALGLILSIFLLDKPTWIPSEYTIIFFIITFFIFYFLSALKTRINNWAEQRTIKNCKKCTIRCIKKARELAPYQAEYNIKSDLVTYSRGNSLAWSKRLKGVAIHGQSATLLFRKWTSIQPIMTILHEDFSPIELVFNQLDIDFKTVSFQK
jgi:hypothetical protein